MNHDTADTWATPATATNGIRCPTPARVVLLLRGAARWTLVAVLVMAGARKLLDPPAFAEILFATGFFPRAIIDMLGWAVPLTEVAVAICLAVARTEFVGLVVAAFLSAAFTGLHGYLYWHGIVVPCGCAGLREAPPGETYHLVMGSACAAMLLIAVALAVFPTRRHKAAPRPT